ncbi:MAG: FAD-dependent oxidoreductase [Dehalococcoidia bacterium]|nr:MAG: FAD-dependent oxidoreductase [Dehalococcoidia bacterium]
MGKLGVFLCDCCFSPMGSAEVEELLTVARRHPDVAYAELHPDMCLNPKPEKVAGVMKENGLEGVVFTSCTSLLHRDTFRELASAAGLAPNQFEVVDLREQIDGKRASERIIEAIENLAAKLTSPQPVFRAELPVTRKALIIGGGVAGIQAALDIADAGYEVFLVERTSSIGGHMLQYSEVFPTLDCPQCIMTPKMVEAGQHENIKLLTYSEVEQVSGQIGNFTVRIRRKASYVDWEKCTGCGDCATVCPVEVYSEYERGIAAQKAIYKLFGQAVPAVFTVEKRGTAPCRIACPAGVNAQGYIALISQGKFQEALEVVRRTMPFAGVIGRVCTHPCETDCERRTVDEPMSIRTLKRFIADYELKAGREKAIAVERTKKEKIAVVGSGPAGLSCAYDLVRKGYPVTVFEAMPMAGGLLRYGIPEYRLPKNVLDNEIDYVRELGVEIRTDSPVEDLNGLFSKGYQAVFLGTGAGVSQKMGIPGEGTPEVIHAIDFLKRVNSGNEVSLGQRVAVIGGGNAAVDAARAAKRLGTDEVTIIYRRSREEMPAVAGEVDEAENEGVKLHILAAPVKVLSQNDKLTGIECLRMELGEPDASGRRRPVPVKGSEFTVDVDNVIVAIGQSVDKAGLPGEIAGTERGTVSADPVTLETNMAGVFAGGDVVSGPADVIGAIAAGKEAAESIDRYLNGVDLREGRPGQLNKVEEVSKEGVQAKPRAAMPMLDLGQREGSFAEVELGLDEETAMAEARRCLNCAGCCECLSCEVACERKAINHEMVDSYEELDVGAIVVATGFELTPKKAITEFEPDPDILDGIQFERILCPGGPTAGVVLRPSDAKTPKEVVFISCVGSRDPEHGVPYCSRVCCMYLAKQAMLYKHAVPDGQAYIFYMDTRSTGKGYEEFVQRAVEEDGVLYLRGRVSKVFRDGDKLKVWGADTLTGKRIELSCDLVVLGMAMIPNPESKELMRILGINTDSHGFINEAHYKLRPLETNIPGIYVAGTAQGPRDIPDSVAQGSGSASKVLTLFSTSEKMPEKVAAS